MTPIAAHPPGPPPAPAPADAGKPLHVGYVLKRYPRYSETFIVNEILAHEEAGLRIDIFSLRPPEDTHFQDSIARVRAPVTYLLASGVRGADFWGALEAAAKGAPQVWTALAAARGEDARNVYQAALLAREVRARGITHLHAHFASDATSVARLAARLAAVPFTFTAHAKDIYIDTVEAADFKRKLEDAAGAVTVSDYNAAYLRETFGAAAGRVRRIYNGLDLQRLTFTRPDGRPPRILTVGRLVEKKGIGDLIDACALLVARGRRFTCQIIGSGELEADLRAQVARLGLAEHVELVGPRPQEEVFAALRSAAAFAAPCIVGADGNRDGLPTVLLEAMALGTPCVSTPVTGIPELVHDDETGLLVPEHDPRALADALDRLLADPALGARLATAARRLIEAEFDIRTNVAALRAVFVDAAGTVDAADTVDTAPDETAGAQRDRRRAIGAARAA